MWPTKVAMTLCHQFKPTESKAEPSWKLLMLKAMTDHREKYAAEPGKRDRDRDVRLMTYSISPCTEQGRASSGFVQQSQQVDGCALTPFASFSLDGLDIMVDQKRGRQLVLRVGDREGLGNTEADHVVGGVAPKGST